MNKYKLYAWRRWADNVAGVPCPQTDSAESIAQGTRKAHEKLASGFGYIQLCDPDGHVIKSWTR